MLASLASTLHVPFFEILKIELETHSIGKNSADWDIIDQSHLLNMLTPSASDITYATIFECSWGR